MQTARLGFDTLRIEEFTETTDQLRPIVERAHEHPIDVRVGPAVGFVVSLRLRLFDLDQIGSTVAHPEAELPDEISIREDTALVTVAPIGTLGRLDAKSHLPSRDRLWTRSDAGEVASEGMRETIPNEVRSGLPLTQVRDEGVGEKVCVLCDGEGHAHGRHVVLGVVDAAAVTTRPRGVVDVQRDAVRLNGLPDHRIADERVLDHEARLAEFDHRIAGTAVQQVVAAATVASEVGTEVLGTE